MSRVTWPTCPIGDLFHISAGKTMSAKAREGLRRTPFLRTSNVFWDEIDLSIVDEMSISDEELAAKSLQKGDLLVCEGGDIGRAAVWMGEREVMSFQNHLHRLRPKTSLTCPRFYVYFLQCGFTQLGIYEGAGNKTTIPNLSRNRLAALEVPLPSLIEQQSISKLLAMVRKGLNTHANAVILAQELKAATMQQLFTCGLRGEAQRETEIGLIPDSWRVAVFAEVREWLQYGTSTKCDEKIGAFPVLRIPNIGAGRVLPDSLKYCNLSDLEAKKYLLEQGDLIFIRTNGVLDRLGSCAVYEGKPEKSLFASYLIRARLFKNVEPRFIAHFYGSTLGTSLVSGRATPASDGKYNLNTGTIDSLPLPLPPSITEQRNIADVLDGIDRKIQLHQQKKFVLDELFRSLLNKLMTGELSVDNLDLSALSTEDPQPQAEAKVQS
jgi:type I restriction enzyme, S subunit